MEPVTVLLNVWGGDALRSIRRSTASILAQTLQPTELLVVADGPLDREVDEFLESPNWETGIPVRIVRVDQPTGVWNARNVGLRESKTELVALQDADDVMHPQRLEIQVTEMTSSQIDVLGSDAFEFDDQSGAITGCRQSPHNQDQLIKKLLINNPLNNSTVMLRRSSVLECGGYRNVYLAEDYDLWLRMASTGSNFRIGENVVECLAVNSKFLDRRGGWKFLRSELLLNKVIKQEFSPRLIFRLARLAIRIIYRLGPRYLRGKVNSSILSNRNVKTPVDLDEFIATDLVYGRYPTTQVRIRPVTEFDV